LALLCAVAQSVCAAEYVAQPAAEIPLIYDVDVLVTGGSSAGVAAAVAAAKSGATVFLAAPQTYLGADMCGTYRLWLEDSEQPQSDLAKQLYEQPHLPSLAQGLSFKYRADIPSAGVHKDSASAPMLSDGKWDDAYKYSVQYDGNVTITADLGAESVISGVEVLAFQRDDDFEVLDVTVSVSSDGKSWKETAVIRNQHLGGGTYEQQVIPLTAAFDVKARYLKFDLRKGPKAGRILLGEIIITSPDVAERKETPPTFLPTPMHIKHTLDKTLFDAGVSFLYGCYPTEILTDDNGNPAGIVITNISGRQAIRAKVIIDATPRATVARLAGVSFGQYPAGKQRFTRVVVGDAITDKEGVKARTIPAGIQSKWGNSRNFRAVEYTLDIDMPDGTFASFAAAEQVARDLTYDISQADSSEVLFQVPPDAMKARKTVSGDWPGYAEISLDAFRPAGAERLYVLGGCADISRAAAGRMLRPVEYIELGMRMGKAAAADAAALRSAQSLKAIASDRKPAVAAGVRELLDDIYPRRPIAGRVSCPETAIEVCGEYDVVVIGGGTAGAPAGIAAGRQGAKTLVVEYLHGLGGVGTLGLISKYYHGNRVGFTAEVDEGLRGMRPDAISSGGWNVEVKMEWYRRQLKNANAELWYGILGTAAVVEGNRVKGVRIATPDGPRIVLAKVVIDSTGMACIAAAAGAQTVTTDGTHIAVQGTGLPPRELGASYTNTDYTFIDDRDVVDIWRSFFLGREKFKDAYDMGQFVDTRERRQIVGDFSISPIDIYNRRTYPDTIVVAMSNFDTHGFTVHPAFYIRPPDRAGMVANVPYRCILPKGLDRIFVTGLGISADRDAMPVIRMQPDVQNQGYAAGVAAAMIARQNITTRALDIKAVQKHLIEKGNLPASVLTDKDSYPIAKVRISEAIENLTSDYEGLEVILASPQAAIPMLRKAYVRASADKALVYARVLGILGDPAGADALVEAVSSGAWDKGWNYTGMGQYGRSISDFDSLIIALGRTGDKRAVKVICDKLEQLDETNADFSHCRAVAMALETIGSPAAAKPLASFLQKPGMMGHADTDIKWMAKNVPSSSTETETRNVSLRELVLARALYKCGDYEGLGAKILGEYKQDYRGYYSRHAAAILSGR
jgi:flavin-dependent dehydrogenase